MRGSVFGRQLLSLSLPDAPVRASCVLFSVVVVQNLNVTGGNYACESPHVKKAHTIYDGLGQYNFICETPKKTWLEVR